MDVIGDISGRQCFKCDQKIHGSLNITSNASKSMLILWNRHQILVYENLTFKSASRIIEPEFQIHNLLLYNNHIACLDCSGNIHVTSLKFKNPTQKRYKSTFQPRKQNMLAFAQYNIDIVATLQCSRDIIYLSFYQINKEFQIEKELQLLFDNEHSTPMAKQENCILKFQSILENNVKDIRQLFNLKENAPINDLVVVTFDKLAVYACVISPNMMEEEINMVKMYSCPSEICNIEIVDGEDLKIVIGLTIGTLIVISLKENNRNPTVIHLNTAIYKFHISKNSIIHTDGSTMWNTQNVFSKGDLKKIFIKQVNDFILIDDKIICTTFSNLIYIFSNNETSYVKSQNVEEYSSADKLINNTDCLNKIMEEVKKNNELVKKLSKEENYITALSLSNRQDIMNNIIHTKIVVYKNYEDAIKEYVPITLTENIQEYFKTDSTLFLINICFDTSHNMFNSILSNLFTDLKIHISFSTETKLLKTTSIKLGEQIKNINYLIPLENTSTTINVNIVFVTNIPGTYDEKHIAWTVLYRKHVLLNSEHFIITNNMVDKVVHLNKTETIDELMLKTVQNVYGNLFDVTDVSKSLNEDEWSLYVKLPANYPEVLKKSDYCDKYLNFKTTEYLTQQYTSEEFLKSKKNFVFMVGHEKVKLEVVNDGFSNPVLKICSRNLKIALDIRNFFSCIVYDEFNNYVPDEEFISHTFYTTVENVQKAVKHFVTLGLEHEEFKSLAERFERNVIGALPI